jgi:ribosomal protein S18 acetylase RimI-like enzyme
MKKGIVSDDVVYVNSTQTKKYPGLKSAIDELTKKCGYVSDLCGVYNSCYSFMGICFDRTIEKKYIEKELSNPKGIVGYFLIVLFPSLIEIYNVCVDPDNRRKGIGTKMMKSITTLDNSILYGDGRGMVNLWLGVDIANPMAEKAGLMYLKSGFRCEKVIKNITPGGQKAPYHIPFWFDRNIEYSYNQDDFIQLIHGIEKTTNQCEIKLVFTKSIFDYIRPMLNDVMEHSGYFKIKSVKDGVGILSIPIKDVKKGTANYAHVPLAFNEFINFHTHPQICYSKYDCVL